MSNSEPANQGPQKNKSTDLSAGHHLESEAESSSTPHLAQGQPAADSRGTAQADAPSGEHSAQPGVVILGTGLAGYGTARELRRAGYAGPVTLVSADDGVSYSKPMLSNALAQGRAAKGLAQARADQMAEQLRATVLAHTAAVQLDPVTKTVALASGQVLRFNEAVLALGADPIRLAIEGSGAAEVLSVNNLADYAVFRQALQAQGPVVVLGGGLIGCEFANDLAVAGREVHVIEPSPWPLGRLVPQQVGVALQQALADSGVAWHLGQTAARIDRVPGSSFEVHLSGGEVVSAAVVLSAVGLQPRTQLARAAGLAAGRGIHVDALLQTSAEGVYALGDCAEIQGSVRPYVQPLLVSARALAKTLAGQPTPVVFAVMPVVVKTPALALVVAPPGPGLVGAWQVQGQGRDLLAWFVDDQGLKRGFAAAGTAAARRDLQAQVVA